MAVHLLRLMHVSWDASCSVWAPSGKISFQFLFTVPINSNKRLDIISTAQQRTASFPSNEDVVRASIDHRRGLLSTTCNGLAL